MDELLSGKSDDKDINDIFICMKDGVKEIAGTMIVKFNSVGSMNKVKNVTLDEMAAIYKERGI